VTGIAVLGLAIASVSILLRVLRQRSEERFRPSVFSASSPGMAAVGAAAWGRSGLRPDYCLDMRKAYCRRPPSWPYTSSQLLTTAPPLAAGYKCSPAARPFCWRP